jgi:FkbH-like protein
MKDLKYSEILRLNNLLESSLKGDLYQITLLSNIITNPLNEILEYSLRSQQINARVTSGNYDNIVQDSKQYAHTDLVIIFWEACNIVEGLQYKANIMSDEDLRAIVNKVKSEIDFVLSHLKETRLVIFNKFSSLLFNHELIKSNNFDKICNELNAYLETKVKSNVVLIDINKVIAGVSVEKSVDFRYYYSSKALYKIDFYKRYVEFINPVILTVKGKSKKVLVFDCDNTLWKGILGEDGSDKIEMSSKTKGGSVFEEIQYLGLDLNKKGILLGLCSKNNSQDIDSILETHPDMILKDENITIKKVNWEDKVSNLKKIAKELNLGLDSIVFVDDSDFEIELIKSNLPEVSVLKVPSNAYEYPQLLRKQAQSFYSVSETKEDSARVLMYQQQKERDNEKLIFGNIESYLESLDIAITIHMDEVELVPRIAQMTQKTNQFNLTTKRYTEAEILKFTTGKEFSVIAFEVRDKYGDSGITGAVILHFTNDDEQVLVDTFLMSCRIIGRNIEFAFFDFLINYLKQKTTRKIKASYIKTPKNEQVADFYETIGFVNTKKTKELKEYEIELNQYISKNINYIKINYGRQD